jgi:haloalkane dehalogenase
MGQDWGGPIGMDVASRRADRVRGLVMGNTWFWPESGRMMRMFSKAMSSRLIQRLIKRRNLFVSPLMKRSLKIRLSDEEFAHYTDVVPTPESREGIAVFPVEIMRSHPWLGELETRVADTLAGKQVVLMFGRKDPALASDSIIDHWQRQFPDATYIDLPDAGHYIQEDAPDEIIGAIRAAFR